MQTRIVVSYACHMRTERFIEGQRRGVDTILAIFVVVIGLMWAATACDYPLSLGWGPVMVVLMREGRAYVLTVPGGGWWRLEVACGVDKGLVGRRVRVVGERVEFNTIAAERVEGA